MKMNYCKIIALLIVIASVDSQTTEMESTTMNSTSPNEISNNLTSNSSVTTVGNMVAEASTEVNVSANDAVSDSTASLGNSASAADAETPALATQGVTIPQGTEGGPKNDEETTPSGAQKIHTGVFSLLGSFFLVLLMLHL